MKYDITVVIPVYNSEKYIVECIESIIKQDYDFEKVEVLFINDGSKDGSQKICEKYAEKYDNIQLINQKNSGVSVARNNGIQRANGKYILFLDSDDYLSNTSLKNLISFFDKHYEEIDLLSYKIIPFNDMTGNTMTLHYRYRYLIEEGVYDLTKPENYHLTITTMNYIIKNDFKNNELFNKDLKMHEDEEFSIRVIEKKMKIGYTPNAEYYYRRNTESATSMKLHPYYFFDKTMEFWENLFKKFNWKLQEYFQSLFINDCLWKLKRGVLHPYHYFDDEYKKQWRRVQKILSHIDDKIIISHPNITDDLAFYLINQKENNNFSYEISDIGSSLSIYNNKKLIYSSSEIDLDLVKINIDNDILKLTMIAKSPLFLYSKKPQLIVFNNNIEIEKIEGKLSAYGLNESEERVSNSFVFDLKIKIDKMSKLVFKINVENKYLNTKIDNLDSLYSGEKCRFMSSKYIYTFEEKEIRTVKIAKKNRRFYKKETFIDLLKFGIKYMIVGLFAWFKARKKQEIWLYYDCKNVKKDNGYYQFCHDLNKKDGIKRYFVTNNTSKFNKGLFSFKQKCHVVRFKSIRHIILYLTCTKVITAYIEKYNYSPISDKTYAKYFRIATKPNIIYLQHGVLNAFMPHKFSREKLNIDKTVISTKFEEHNMLIKYNYNVENLIKSGMPRYDHIELINEKKNAILFAPSWRMYLVLSKNGKFLPTNSTFIESDFYKKINSFINSKELADLLEKYDMQLDLSLHPIFRMYNNLFSIKSNRISITKRFHDNEYKIFMTDFSSFTFDFIYQSLPIIYFVPDYKEFKSGFNLYKELDMPLESACGEFVQTEQEALEALKKILKAKCNPLPKYKDRMKDFFFYYDRKQCDRIYDELINDRRD